MYVYIKIIPRGIEQINMYLDSIIIRVIHRPESYYNVSTKILISIM